MNFIKRIRNLFGGQEATECEAGPGRRQTCEEGFHELDGAVVDTQKSPWGEDNPRHMMWAPLSPTKGNGQPAEYGEWGQKCARCGKLFGKMYGRSLGKIATMVAPGESITVSIAGEV